MLAIVYFTEILERSDFWSSRIRCCGENATMVPFYSVWSVEQAHRLFLHNEVLRMPLLNQCQFVHYLVVILLILFRSKFRSFYIHVDHPM